MKTKTDASLPYSWLALPHSLLVGHKNTGLVDHGKSSLTNSLAVVVNIIAREVAGDVRMIDTH